MTIEYLRDADMRSRMDGMLYGEFKEMFPVISNTKNLPRPETIVKTHEDDTYLIASDADASLIVFGCGLYCYKEAGHGTVYSVSECAVIKYTFAVGSWSLTQEDTLQMPWYYPLVLVGSHRLEENRASNDGGRHKFHYGADTSWLPGLTGRCRTVEMREMTASAHTQHLYTLWMEGKHCLTGRQEEIMHYRVDLNMKQEEIARLLQISQPTVSDIISRAKARLREYAMSKNK